MVPPRIPQGSRDTCTYPRNNLPCAGPERLCRRPPASWSSAIGEAWPKGGSTRPTSGSEAVEEVMYCDGCPKAAVQDNHYRLAKHLHQSNTPKFSTPLCDKEHRLPSCLLYKQAFPELSLQHIHHFHPVGGIRCLHLSGLHKPAPQVLHPHP